MEENQAYFKVEVPGFKDLSDEVKQILRDGVQEAKLYLFYSAKDDETGTRIVEAQIQWPCDENSFYQIMIADDLSPHNDAMIFDELKPCKLATCNTKLYLQSKNSQDRTEICDVIVRTIFNSKALATSDLEIDVTTSYDDPGGRAFVIPVTQDDPELPKEFSLQDACYGIDADEFLSNGYIPTIFNINYYGELSERYVGDDISELYIGYYKSVECGYTYQYEQIDILRGGNRNIEVTVPAMCYKYERIPRSDYTIVDGHISLTAESNIDFTSGPVTVCILYKASDFDDIREVTGKLTFKQSSVEIPYRYKAKLIEVTNNLCYGTFIANTNNDRISNSMEWLKLSNYGITAFINDEPVTVYGLKSYSKNKPLYVSGDLTSDETLTEYDLVNYTEEGDTADVVTAYVSNIPVNYTESPNVITLYLPNKEYPFYQQQCGISSSSTPNSSYTYDLYTDEDRTNLFTIDPTKNYTLTYVSSYGALDPVTSTGSNTTDYVRAHVEDLPSYVNSYIDLIELLPNGKLWLGYGTSYTYARIDLDYVHYIVTDKE